MIFDYATSKPEELALDDLFRRRSWAELYKRSSRVARFLVDELGLQPTDHVAVLMGNRVEYVELVLGAMQAGVWLTPINSHLQSHEIAYILEDSGSGVLFCDDDHRSLFPRAGDNLRVLVAGDELDAVLSACSSEAMPLDGPPGAVMIYTSGTTGRPKGVKRARPSSLGEAFEAAAGAGRTIGLDGSGPHLVTGPLYHAAPLLFAVYDLLNGAPLVIMPRWEETRALSLIEDRGIRHSHMVPTMFVRLLRLPEGLRRSFDPSSMRLLLHGAAPVSPAVKARMIEWWGEILVEYWGATESGVCTLVDSADWLARPGTVGRATQNFEVFAVDGSGRRLPAGELGKLYCRHKLLPDPFEYHRDPAKTAEAYLEPAVFTLGDLGRVDADGYVFLCDRESNTIISGGVNVYPAEIEQVLQQHDAVADAAVFGVPDDEWGESVKAAVELLDGFKASAGLEEDILAHARTRLAAYKVPRSVDFEDRLPRFPSGKLHTRLLRDRYWEHLERKV